MNKKKAKIVMVGGLPHYVCKNCGLLGVQHEHKSGDCPINGHATSFEPLEVSGDLKVS